MIASKAQSHVIYKHFYIQFSGSSLDRICSYISQSDETQVQVGCQKNNITAVQMVAAQDISLWV